MNKMGEGSMGYFKQSNFIALHTPDKPELRGIRFLLFEIILVLVYILTIFKVTDLFV